MQLSGTEEGKETPQVYLIIFTWIYFTFSITKSNNNKKPL